MDVEELMERDCDSLPVWLPLVDGVPECDPVALKDADAVVVGLRLVVHEDEKDWVSDELGECERVDVIVRLREGERTAVTVGTDVREPDTEMVNVVLRLHEALGEAVVDDEGDVVPVAETEPVRLTELEGLALSVEVGDDDFVTVVVLERDGVCVVVVVRVADKEAVAESETDRVVDGVLDLDGDGVPVAEALLVGLCDAESEFVSVLVPDGDTDGVAVEE
jgi:hypothetical protein